MTEMSDEELRELVALADEEALAEGASPFQRGIPVLVSVMKKLGHATFVFAGHATSPLVQKIIAIHQSMYRPSDLGIGGIHGGIFMFRDVFARIDVPVILGRVAVKPLEMTDLSESQLKWLSFRPADLKMFYDQFSDIFDFAGVIAPFAGYKVPPKEALDLFRLASFQLQAAAAALSVAFDFRGAIQSALIGAELALKAGLAANGVDEKARRKHSHDLASAAKAFAVDSSRFDRQRVLATINKLPAYVENRYSPEQPGRLETGHIVMGAQYIAGEVVRQVAGFSIRSADEQAGRFYPPV